MRTNARDQAVEILLVEDNPGDVDLIREGLEGAGARYHLSVVENGAEALDFLRRRGRYAQAVRPDLILLDLNLPVMDGRETLQEIKAYDELRRIPVIVLTTSEKVEDVLHCYDLHANCYLTKPLGLEAYLRVMQGIQEFWLTLVTLPSAVPGGG